MTVVSRNFIRPAQFVLAAIVAITTLVVVAHAAESLATAQKMSIAYKLAPGANSGAIKPVANTPVLILADQTGVACDCDDVGSSLMTVVNSTVDRELVWNGFESNNGGLTSGFSPVAGTHIMYIDFGHVVDLEVSNATSFHVHNASTSETYNGTVTLVW
jgi:hypothetical protein